MFFAIKIKTDLKNFFVQKSFFFQYLLFFQSQSCLLESTVAIFRQSAGYVFGHAETGNGAKKRVVLRREFFALILKWSEKTVFEQKMAFSLVIFCSHAAILLRFLPFLVFWIGCFFRWFSQLIHSCFQA